MSAQNRLPPLRNASALPMPVFKPFRWYDVLLLVAGYVALDWASYINPLYGLNITPWNPAPAVCLVYLLHFGPRMLPAVVMAKLLAEAWVRGMPVSLITTALISVLLALVYWGIAHVLRRVQPEGGFVSDSRGLFLWAVLVAAGTLAGSTLFVLMLAASDYVPVESIGSAVARHWVGDAIGVIVAMPLLQMLVDEGRRRELAAVVMRREFVLSVAMIALALWIAFVPGAAASFKYLYVLFLPIAWVASRAGMAGAVTSATLVQMGIIAAVQWQGIGAVTMVEMQLLAGSVALFGFFIGIVVDEKVRISEELRETLRLAAAGEMAGALAHELNQPLTAVSNYGSACQQLLEKGETGPLLRDTVGKMVHESFRAAEVLRRLRDFFRTGSTRLAPVRLDELIGMSVSSFANRAGLENVSLTVAALPECELMCDRLQLDVVMRNLLSNAFDAVAEREPGDRTVTISAVLEIGSRVSLCIEDSGRGFDEAGLARLFENYQTTKSSGLGLGLVISRAIVEAHGGSLWAETADHGVFRLSLPAERILGHAH